MLRVIGIQMNGPCSMASKVGEGGQLVTVKSVKESLAYKDVLGGITSSWVSISVSRSI